MAKILLTWELGEGYGHCVNHLPIARDLAARGHQVVFAARSPETARKVFDGLRVEIIAAPPRVPKPAYALPGIANYAQLLHNVGFGDDVDLEQQLQAWRKLVLEFAPDTVVIEHSPTALLASRWHDCHRVLVGNGFNTPPDESPIPALLLDDPVAVGRMASDEQDVLDRVNRFLRRDRLAPLERVGQLFSAVDASYLLTFPELDHYRERGVSSEQEIGCVLGNSLGDSQWPQYCGMWPASGGVPPQWPGGSGPHVFTYLKSTPSFPYARPLLAALAKAGLRVLAHVPDADKDLCGLPFENLRIENEPIHVERVARTCAFAVTNGGIGVTTHLLRRGVPVLSAPIHAEQQAFCRRVDELGAGRTVYGDDPIGVVRAIEDMMLSQEYRRRAAEFAEKYAGVDLDESVRHIVETIDRLSGP